MSVLPRTLASRLASCRFDAAATVWNDTLIVHGGYQAAGLSVASSAAFDLRLVLDVYLANAMATCASIRIAASIIALGSWLPDALACSGTAGSQAGHSLAVATGPHNGTLLIVGSFLEESVEVRSVRAPLFDKVSRAWWSNAACLSGCSCRKHSLRQASSCAAGLLPTAHTMPQGLSICASGSGQSGPVRRPDVSCFEICRLTMLNGLLLAWRFGPSKLTSQSTGHD